MIEMHDNHRATNLIDKILKILQPYGIDVRRILSVTTSNMNATINRLKLVQYDALNYFDSLMRIAEHTVDVQDLRMTIWILSSMTITKT